MKHPHPMTPRQRLLAPFQGITPDRPALLADLSYWYSAAKAAGTLEKQYDGQEGYKRLHKDLGVCYYYDYADHEVFTTRYEGATVETKESPTERRRFWRTPKGELTDCWHYLPQSSCWALVEYAVKTVDDFPVMMDLFQRVRYAPAYEEYARLDAWIGASGIPLAAVPRSPLPALLADWCGVEQTIFFLMDHPDVVAEALAVIDRANDMAFEIIGNAPCSLLHFCDNLDSSASTPFFEEHMKACYARRLKQLHQAGKFAVVHLDGRVRGLLPKLAKCGFDGVESITPAPVGDVTVEETRGLADNDRLVLWGGIPGAMFCAPWSERDVCAQTRQVMEHWGKQGRLVVGTADQIPPDGAIGWCRAIADAIELG